MINNKLMLILSFILIVSFSYILTIDKAVKLNSINSGLLIIFLVTFGTSLIKLIKERNVDNKK